MKLTEIKFLENVKTHSMHVLHDDGIYRHLRFKRPGTNCMHFDLVTWPGYLAYSGDMGEKGHEARPSKRHLMRSIRTLDDLAQFILEAQS